ATAARRRRSGTAARGFPGARCLGIDRSSWVARTRELQGSLHYRRLRCLVADRHRVARQPVQAEVADPSNLRHRDATADLLGKREVGGAVAPRHYVVDLTNEVHTAPKLDQHVLAR